MSQLRKAIIAAAREAGGRATTAPSRRRSPVSATGSDAVSVREECIRAARMTAACSEVRHSWNEPEDRQFSATLWVAQAGEHVVGFGPDEWTAVQAAHAIAETARGRGR